MRDSWTDYVASFDRDRQHQFLGGLVLGLVCGVILCTIVAVWWIQDRGIVRAARGVTSLGGNAPTMALADPGPLSDSTVGWTGRLAPSPDSVFEHGTMLRTAGVLHETRPRRAPDPQLP